jgi:hypothetical protein
VSKYNFRTVQTRSKTRFLWNTPINRAHMKMPQYEMNNNLCDTCHRAPAVGIRIAYGWLTQTGSAKTKSSWPHLLSRLDIRQRNTVRRISQRRHPSNWDILSFERCHGYRGQIGLKWPIWDSLRFDVLGRGVHKSFWYENVWRAVIPKTH